MSSTERHLKEIALRFLTMFGMTVFCFAKTLSNIVMSNAVRHLKELALYSLRFLTTFGMTGLSNASYITPTVFHYHAVPDPHTFRGVV